MSRVGLILGLVVSTLLHVILLAGPVPQDRSDPPMPPVAEVLPMPAPKTSAPETPNEQPSPAKAEEAPDPQPLPLAQSALPAPAPLPNAGSFAGADDAESTREPSIRIDWGGPKQVQGILKAGQMKVIVLGAGTPPAIKQELRFTSLGWRASPYEPGRGLRYSNRLRIVDDVPAFADAVASVNLSSNERMAVLVPESIEGRIFVAVRAAAYQQGLSLDQVASVGGRFVLRGNSLRFEVTGMKERS